MVRLLPDRDDPPNHARRGDIGPLDAGGGDRQRMPRLLLAQKHSVGGRSANNLTCWAGSCHRRRMVRLLLAQNNSVCDRRTDVLELRTGAEESPRMIRLLLPQSNSICDWRSNVLASWPCSNCRQWLNWLLLPKNDTVHPRWAQVPRHRTWPQLRQWMIFWISLSWDNGRSHHSCRGRVGQSASSQNRSWMCRARLLGRHNELVSAGDATNRCWICWPDARQNHRQRMAARRHLLHCDQNI